jgi:hypothetical protein
MKPKLDQIGWREWVRLPSLSQHQIKAKIDTGARTSALHAFGLRSFDREEMRWVSFELHPHQRSAIGATRVEVPVAAYRRVKSSSGHMELRPVIVVDLRVGLSTFPIELTLTSRDSMGFRMLLGRAALRRRYLVNPGRSYITG